MKYLKLFENFEQNDFILIFTNIKDNDNIKVYMSGDLGDHNVTFINIEPLKNNICPYCESGQIIEVFYDKNGDRYKDEVDCSICSGDGELEYFEWDVIKDTIYNFYNYVDEDYYVECTTVGKGDTNFTHSDITTNYSLPLSEFLSEIDTNWKMQKIIDFSIVINEDFVNEGFLKTLKDYWNADTSKKIPDISELKDLCTDSLIDIEDSGLNITYNYVESGVKFDHSRNYTEDRDTSFTIKISGKGEGFYTDVIRSEILFVIDLLKSEYNFDSTVIIYDEKRKKPKHISDGPFDYMNDEYYDKKRTQNINIDAFEKMPDLKLKNFSITFNNITKK